MHIYIIITRSEPSVQVSNKKSFLTPESGPTVIQFMNVSVHLCII